MRWMLLLGALLSATLASAAESALFLFELGGVPVGTVELRWDRAEGTYRYTSTQLFSRDGDRQRRTRVARFEVDAAGRDRRTGRFPEGLVLWRGPGALSGCVEAIEELGQRSGEVCFEDAGRGSVLGEGFVAQYGADGLRTLAMGQARFVRVPRGTSLPPPPDVFAQGFPIRGVEGALALDPEIALAPPEGDLRAAPSEGLARSLAREVTGSFDVQRASAADFAHDPEATAASCLGHALRYRDRARLRGFDAVLVHGLVVFVGEAVARPHAWVRVVLDGGRFLDLDPTLDVEVTRSTHLPLALVGEGSSSRAGETWLRLLSGRQRVIRR